MQKWEYLYVQTLDDRILRVNGQLYGKYTVASPGTPGEPIHDFLNRVGREGWELVGVVNTYTNANETGLTTYHNLFLKRGV